MSRVDIVIFGATGFTGRRVVEQVVKGFRKYRPLTWGIAGRSLADLQELVKTALKNSEQHGKTVKIIVADANNEASLREMCSATKVLVNCCGPYQLYGEAVVRAAIDSKCHYLDISGEPLFIEKMELLYDERARAAGVYVISACGYDCVPNDMGIVFLQQKFEGTLNSVESYMTADIPKELRMKILQSGCAHYGTWASLVYSIANSHELGPLRKKLFTEKLPVCKPTLEKRGVHRHAGAVAVPFLGADRSVVRRTQRRLHAADGRRPVQFRPYVAFSSVAGLLLVAVSAFFLYLLTRTRWTTKALLKWPRLFSLGLVSRRGPAREVMEATRYASELRARGWPPGADCGATRPGHTLVARVSGVNPGYGATAQALLCCALTVLREQDSMPAGGGVLTTGVAFEKTNLIELLNEHDMKFEILDPQ